jgi:hypothetical protein
VLWDVTTTIRLISLKLSVIMGFHARHTLRDDSWETACDESADVGCLAETWCNDREQVASGLSYNAVSRQAADRLCALLQEQTDYEVKVESSGSFLRRRWRVAGRTQETAVSPEILDQWVTWMVTAGKERSCDFDGWGTHIGWKLEPHC